MHEGEPKPASGSIAAGQSGIAMIALVVVLMPLVLIVGAFTITMTAKGKRLVGELAEEKAFQAAEAAVDECVFRAETGTLASGTTITRNLGGGLSFSVVPTYLRTDGEDNDGDALVDEADEDVFRLIVTGQYRNASRRFAAYLGPVSWLPVLESAATVQNPAIDLQLSGTPQISGFDTNLDGTPGDAVNDRPALTINAPGTVTDLLGTLTVSEQSLVVGPGGAPSVAVSSPIDVAALAVAVQNSANLVLTNGVYGSYHFGNAQAGTANITYCQGNVKFTGNSRGAGVLLVTGDLEVAGTFRFDGIVIVLGKFRASAGTADIYGGVVLGPSSDLLRTSGTANFHYSAQALSVANSRSGRYVAFNGWQELAR